MTSSAAMQLQQTGLSPRVQKRRIFELTRGAVLGIEAYDLFSEPMKWLALDGGRAAAQDPLPLAVAATGCALR